MPGTERAVFVYGTLLDPRIFARFAGRAPLRRALPARLPGWQRVMLRGTPYPTLVRAAAEVQGLLLPRLAPAALARLAAYEGASYALVPVRLTTRRGPRRARAWVAPRWRADPGAPWTPARGNVSAAAPPAALDVACPRTLVRQGVG